MIDLGPRGGSGVDLGPGILHLRSNNGSSSMSIILSYFISIEWNHGVRQVEYMQ